MQSRLSIASLWSPAGKVLTSWFSCVFRFIVFLSLSYIDIVLIHIRTKGDIGDVKHV